MTEDSELDTTNEVDDGMIGVSHGVFEFVGENTVFSASAVETAEEPVMTTPFTLNK